MKLFAEAISISTELREEYSVQNVFPDIYDLITGFIVKSDLATYSNPIFTNLC
jgi:hypothetical protein